MFCLSENSEEQQDDAGAAEAAAAANTVAAAAAAAEKFWLMVGIGTTCHTIEYDKLSGSRCTYSTTP